VAGENTLAPPAAFPVLTHNPIGTVLCSLTSTATTAMAAGRAGQLFRHLTSAAAAPKASRNALMSSANVPAFSEIKATDVKPALESLLQQLKSDLDQINDELVQVGEPSVNLLIFLTEPALTVLILLTKLVLTSCISY
jgi:endonuclease III